MKRLLLAAIFLAVVVGAAFYLRSEHPQLVSDLQKLESETIKSAVTEIKKVQAPPPLRVAPKASPPSNTQPPLTKKGTIEWTNIERKQNGLPVLSEDTKLDLIASLRMKDLFAKQYFAHVSPTGEKAETVAKYVGYDFLSLGENLALGTFDDDKDLVTAWMNSPGHRANILNTHYDQIGVAVGRGTFEGKTSWIGVQIFGRPASECLAPNPATKTQIDTNEATIETLKAGLDQKKAEVNATDSRDPSYNQKVNEYNALVDQYNGLLSVTKSLISTYNTSVDAFNTCIAS